jgi:hypothetical protein
MARTRKTAAVGLYNELIAQAQFVKNPNHIVFVPVMGKGPIDMVVLDLKTGEYQAYDVKSVNKRKKDYIPSDKYKRNAIGSVIRRGLTVEQKKLKVKIYYNK